MTGRDETGVPVRNRKRRDRLTGREKTVLTVRDETGLPVRNRKRRDRIKKERLNKVHSVSYRCHVSAGRVKNDIYGSVYIFRATQ